MQETYGKVTLDKQKFVGKCEQVYKEHETELESKHLGKIVALYEDGVAAIGSDIDNALNEAHTKFPNKVFYVRRIGKQSAAAILF